MVTKIIGIAFISLGVSIGLMGGLMAFLIGASAALLGMMLVVPESQEHDDDDF